ncbi:MAG: imidazole glycerol phosphate synthase subunit HisH [Lachnospiraceae bacterium]|jgi:glutamine amidotransferase|nr:imidazole glycerol phosphate synthase subunit HisH [Lachnospiraceae bacterium]
MIAVINYGLGNVGSILNMLKKIGAKDSILAQTPSEIAQADKLILPGVGAFDTGMELLHRSGLINAMNIHVLENKKPILGICLGMQMLGLSSEEGVHQGLGYIDFRSKKFLMKDKEWKIPHMGWDYVEVVKKENPLVSESKPPLKYYFVHSYHAVCKNFEDILMNCDYGYTFTAAVNKNNIYGVQFHPEKSHKYGMELLSNFVKACG